MLFAGRTSVLLAVCSAVFTVGVAGAQQGHRNAAPTTHFTLSDSLPTDTTVTIGKLENGLTYYIKKVAKPEHRAELRLVVRAGSNEEDDDQRGLAHLVEHMQFNGSPHFPKKGDLIAYFQSIGMNFGADLNAFTSFDQTQYELRLPSNDAKQLERGFDVLQDWAGRATFTEPNVVAERGIVLEEWRRQLGMGKRIMKEQLPVVFKGSRYAEREPIGDPEIIKSATLDKLQRFYHDWYRPDLMAVIAVGDFDAAQVEQWIKGRFSILRNPVSERPRPVFPIPDNTDPLVSIVADTEQTAISVGVSYKFPRTALATVGDYRESLVRQLFVDALNQRLYERGFTDPAPYVGASASYGSMGETMSTFDMHITTRNGDLMQGMDAAFSEAERIARFGITSTELERMRSNILRNIEMSQKQAEDPPAGAYVQAYTANFINGGPILDGNRFPGIVEQVLPTITGDEIKREAAVWHQTKNRIITVMLPKANTVMIPETSSLLAVFSDVTHAPLVAHVERPVLKPLMDTPPAGGTIVSTRRLPFGITEWMLSNGIRVLVKPTSNTPNSILIRGSGPGGYAREFKHGFISALLASDVITSGGVGDFDPVELGKIISGRAVRYQVGIGRYEQTLAASARLEDFETALQLLYLQVTQPRLDPISLATLKRNLQISLANRNAHPERVFGDTVKLTMSKYNPMVRATILTQATIDSLDGERALESFKDCFRDMGQFDFVIVGSFRPDSIAPLVARYLGGMPGTPVSGPRKVAAARKVKDLGIHAPDGVIHKVVAQGAEPKTTVHLVFHGPLPALPTLKSDWDFYALVQVLRMRLLERLRMQMSGTYAVSVDGTYSTSPTPEYDYSISVAFVCEPHRADELTQAALAVMDSMQRAPATPVEVQTVREQQLHRLELEDKNDGVLLASIDVFNREGWPFTALRTGAELVRQWTDADVQDAAKQYFNFKRYARFDLVPSEMAARR